MLTYQDFLLEQDTKAFVLRAINEHKSSKLYKTACSADNYNKQQNETIMRVVQEVRNMLGDSVEDWTSSNIKLCSNFFHRLNVQRNTYLLGNGVSFSDHVEERSDKGEKKKIDTTKEALGKWFDQDLKKLGEYALIHGVSFGFWNFDRLYVFPVTEFVPLWDEETNALRAGIRFWKLDENKPLMVVLYEEDGYTKYRSTTRSGNGDLEEVQPKRAYIQTYQRYEATDEVIVTNSNYSTLPIIPLWGSSLHQSTLIGMQSKIDSYDLIRSGFANDLADCSEIYWIVSGAAGMGNDELQRFLDRIRINHIAPVDEDESRVTPYQQEIPYMARQAYLDMIRAGIYEDFGGLDVHTVAAGATNDHIDAAYQPMDEEADDYEYQIIDFIQGVLTLMGIDDTPVFKRNRISNQTEQTQMVLSAGVYLDEETVLRKLPFINVDEVDGILARRDADEISDLKAPQKMKQDDEEQEDNKDEEEEQ